MPLRPGNTFLLHGTGGAGNPDGAHLMVCLAVDQKKDTAVVVPITTRHELSDASCVLNVGDHPFIDRESCASYDFARELCLSETESKIDEGKIKLRDSVSDAVLKRLQVGFVVSDETAPRIFQAGNGPALTVFLKHKGLIK